MDIWWAVRSGHAPSELGVVQEFEHNLLGTDKNALQRLAGTTTPLSRALDAAIDDDIGSRLETVLRSLSSGELVRITVALLLEAHFGKVAAQILLVSRAALGHGEFENQMHLACERMMAYSLARDLLAALRPVDEEQEASSLAKQAFLLHQAGKIRQARKLYEESRSKLASLEDGGADVAYRTRDFILRGWLELEKEHCFAIWGATRRHERARQLLQFCKQLQVAAQNEDVATAAILDLRAAELAFAAAPKEKDRHEALEAAAAAMRGLVGLQHAEGVAAVERLLVSAGGKEGRRLVEELDPWAHLGSPRARYRQAALGQASRALTSLPFSLEIETSLEPAAETVNRLSTNSCRENVLSSFCSL